MVTTEDRIHATIQNNEAQVKNTRGKIIPLLTFENGAIVVDTRYKSELLQLQQEEKKLREDTKRLEHALNKAVELSNPIPGVDSSNPYAWLLWKQQDLTKTINWHETEVTRIKRKLEGSSDVMVHGTGIQGRTWQDDYKDRLKEFDAKLGEMRSELKIINSVLHEIEKLYRNAAPDLM